MSIIGNAITLGGKGGSGQTQSKTVTPGDSVQIILPDSGYDALSAVRVEAVPQGYGKIGWNGAFLTVS